MKRCLFLYNSMSPFSRKKVYGGEIVDQELISQCQVTPEKHHLSGLVGLQIGFDDDDNIQHLSKLLMPERHLVYLSLDLFIDGGRLQVGCLKMAAEAQFS